MYNKEYIHVIEWNLNQKINIEYIKLKTSLGKHDIYQMDKCSTWLKAYRLSKLNLLVYIESCQYSMFYTNKSFWTKSQA